MNRTASQRRSSHSRRVRVTFVGFETFWMQVLVDGLSSRYPDVLDCAWILWPSTWLERARFVRAMMRSDVVIRVGMPFEFESETNRLWLHWVLRSRHVHGVNYWIGYDSWVYMRRSEITGPTDSERLALDGLTHLAATENIAGALRASGVQAEAVYFPSPDREVPAEPPPLPDRFRALLYWRDGTWEYSSGPELLSAARRLPDIEFDVVGASGSHIPDVPPNMSLHGRVANMERMYARAVVVIRMVEWDAVPGAMVEEALLFGRYVIYSFEFRHTVFVAHADEDELVAVLSTMRDAHARGELPLNLEGRDSMIRAWVPDTHWSALRDQLLRIYREPARRTATRTSDQ